MKRFEWDEGKNNQLQKERGLSFEALIVAIETGKLIDVLPHPNPKYKHQYIFVVDMFDYVVYVPFVEDDEKIFLKTAFYNRKATRDYFGSKKNERH